MKGGLSVGRRPEILHNVRRRLGNETVCVELKWSVKCRVTISECRCQATLIFGWMSVSNGKNGPVSGVGNTPFRGPNIGSVLLPNLILILQGSFIVVITWMNYLDDLSMSLRSSNMNGRPSFSLSCCNRFHLPSQASCKLNMAYIKCTDVSVYSSIINEDTFYNLPIVYYWAQLDFSHRVIVFVFKCKKLNIFLNI